MDIWERILEFEDKQREAIQESRRRRADLFKVIHPIADGMVYCNHPGIEDGPLAQIDGAFDMLAERIVDAHSNIVDVREGFAKRLEAEGGLYGTQAAAILRRLNEQISVPTPKEESAKQEPSPTENKPFAIEEREVWVVCVMEADLQVAERSAGRRGPVRGYGVHRVEVFATEKEACAYHEKLNTRIWNVTIERKTVRFGGAE